MEDRVTQRYPPILEQTSLPSNQMATMTMPAASAYPPSRESTSWEDQRNTTSRLQSDRVELPSIRQIIPEIDTMRPESQRIIRPDDPNAPVIESTSSSPGYGNGNKRRIITPENEREAALQQDYASSGYHYSPPRQPVSSGVSMYPSPDPYQNERAPMYHPDPSRTPRSFDPARAPADYRSNLPYPGPRERGPYPEYPLQQSQYPPPQYDQPPPGYANPVYGYQAGYDPREAHMKRPAYPPVSYEPHYHQAHEGYPPDMQQQPELKAGRRRRGNLPKETTDKLRGWFMAHLHHPYPTEDQKQDLMLQTGLQMNQISNWFINARRRQLPAMINNQKAESDARSTRSHEPGMHMMDGDSDDDTNYEDYDSGRSHGSKNEKL